MTTGTSNLLVQLIVDESKWLTLSIGFALFAIAGLLYRTTATVSVGESVRIIRELQELTQNELSEQTGIPKSTISAIENDRINLGVERAKVISRALKCHPAVLVFPGWNVDQESAV